MTPPQEVKFIVELRVKQFIAISVNTLLAIIRQPLILLLTIVCLIVIGIMPLAVMFDLGEAGKLVRDGALAFHFVFGLLIAIAAASAAVSGQISKGTASTVLSKPVSRPLFFLATYAGIVLTILLFSFTIFIATLMSVRIGMSKWTIDWLGTGFFFGSIATGLLLAAFGNFLFKRAFIYQAFLFIILSLLIAFLICAFFNLEGHIQVFGTWIQWRILPASILITMALLILAAIAISLSTCLSPILTFVLCVIIFFAGLISDYLFKQVYPNSFLMVACYAILPHWQDFWWADALSADGTISWNYVCKAGAYAVLYLTAVLGLGLISFRRMEIH